MKQGSIAKLTGAALTVLLLGGLIPTASAAEESEDLTVAPTVLTDKLQGINSQPTVDGKKISTIKLNGGELYVGYGDWSNNTGPIDLYSYGTKDGKASFKLKVPTEAVDVFSEINGKLYAPYIDPKADWDVPSGFASNRDGTWKNYDYVKMIHGFDVASTDGKNLFISGSLQEGTRYYAGIWYSPDGENDWQLVRKLTSPTNQGETDRYFWMKTSGGKLYASAKIGGQRTLDTWENGSWKSTPISTEVANALNPQSTNDLQIVGDRIISTLIAPNTKTTAPIQNMVYSISENRLLDPSETKVDFGNPWDPDNGQSFTRLNRSGNTLYGMTGGGRLYSSTDAINWKLVMVVADAISPGPFEVDAANSKIYLGMNPTMFTSIKVPHILVADMPKPATPGDGGGSTGGKSAFCMVASSEHGGKTLKGAAGGNSCVGLGKPSS